MRLGKLLTRFCAVLALASIWSYNMALRAITTARTAIHTILVAEWAAEQVRNLAPHTDGVVVGSALVEQLESGGDPVPFLRALRL